jgi:periplasmic protein TonB
MTGVMKYRSGKKSLAYQLVHRGAVLVGASALTLVFFLVLPIIQAINEPPAADLMRYGAHSAELPPPVAPPVEDEPVEEEEVIPPEELDQPDQLLDLSQLELALSSELGGGWGGAGFGQIKLPSLTGGLDGDDDAAFAGAGFDQEARATYKHSPTPNAAIRRKIQDRPGTVWLAFIVDVDGRVIQPRVLSSPDPIFEGPALAALNKWRFEPRRQNGTPVRSPMKVPITFKKRD